MAEYIDKELAIEGMWAGLKEGTICGPEDTETFLHSLPAADVEPVRHGRWEYVSNVSKTRGLFACSICGGSPPYKASGIRDIKAPYCPNCGAHMDGEA